MSTNNVLAFHRKPKRSFNDIIIGTGADNTKVEHTDLFELTDHANREEADLRAVRDTDCRHFRQPFAGYKIQPSVGVFDFTQTDRTVAILQDLDFVVTADLLHHNNFTHLKDGFLNPNFVDSFTNYVQKFRDRYPSISEINPINEPFTDAVFSMHQGKWYPHRENDIRALVRGFANLAKALCTSTRALKLDAQGHLIPNSVKTVHIDTCEHHQALDAESESYAAYRNNLRFVCLDLALGVVDEVHPLYKFLTRRGVTEAELEWFRRNPAIFDVLGLNYYFFHEQQWRHPRFHGDQGWIRPSLNPLGFAAIAKQYWEHLQDLVRQGKLSPELVPTEVRLTEFNERGTVSDRISALKYICEQGQELLSSEVPFTQISPYPDRDTVCWSTECTKIDMRPDPHGMIFWMDESLNRHESELSYWFSELAQHKSTPADINAYAFLEPIDSKLIGFKKFMNHWKWVTPGVPDVFATHQQMIAANAYA